MSQTLSLCVRPFGVSNSRRVHFRPQDWPRSDGFFLYLFRLLVARGRNDRQVMHSLHNHAYTILGKFPIINIRKSEISSQKKEKEKRTRSSRTLAFDLAWEGIPSDDQESDPDTSDIRIYKMISAVWLYGGWAITSKEGGTLVVHTLIACEDHSVSLRFKSEI
jgi:hypothetical protein